MVAQLSGARSARKARVTDATPACTTAAISSMPQVSVTASRRNATVTFSPARWPGRVVDGFFVPTNEGLEKTAIVKLN